MGHIYLARLLSRLRLVPVRGVLWGWMMRTSQLKRGKLIPNDVDTHLDRGVEERGAFVLETGFISFRGPNWRLVIIKTDAVDCNINHSSEDSMLKIRRTKKLLNFRTNFEKPF